MLFSILGRIRFWLPVICVGLVAHSLRAESPEPRKGIGLLMNLSEKSLPELSLPPGGPLRLWLVLDLAGKLELNGKAPSRAQAVLAPVEPEAEKIFSEIKALKTPESLLELSVTAGTRRAELRLETALYYCPAGGKSVCYIKSYRFIQPLRFVEGGARADLRFTAPLAAPEG